MKTTTRIYAGHYEVYQSGIRVGKIEKCLATITTNWIAYDSEGFWIGEYSSKKNCLMMVF